MLTIDGSKGEGGGQILRTALALSAVTATPFRIERIRAGRPKPGLLRQHLTAVQAAAAVCGAHIEGAALGSRELSFVPGAVRPGEYSFAVGTAGSATLVLQTVLPPLLRAEAPSRLVLEGGTHNPWAPPFDFLARSFLPLLNRMGPTVEARLLRWGFYPAGGGALEVSVTPSPLRRLDLVLRGEILARRGRAAVANLPRSIAARELEVLRQRLSLDANALELLEVRSAPGPGNAVMVDLELASHTEVFTGFGEVGKAAEAVAEGVATKVNQYLDAQVPVGRYLADQILIPLALAGGGSFRTLPPSGHTTTNIETIRRFLDIPITCTALAGPGLEVRLGDRTKATAR